MNHKSLPTTTTIMTLSLDFTPCTLDARPLTQGKLGFPAHVALNISLGTSFAQ